MDNFKKFLKSLIKYEDTIVIHCQTKEESEELSKLLNIDEHKFSAFYKGSSRYNLPAYEYFDCCLIKNGDVIGYGSREQLDKLSWYMDIFDFCLIRELYRNSNTKHKFEVGDLVEDTKHDMYGVILDIASDEDVYVFTDNSCVELWDINDLTYTGEKKDLSFLKIDRPNELEY